jgi:hypothetical protein
MFIASFRLKTLVQKLLLSVREVIDFPTFHPGRAMLQVSLEETVQYIRERMPSAVAVETAREALELALRHVSVDGHFLECGVYKGGTIRFIAQRLPTRQVHGFDSFSGLPEAWAGNTSTFDAKGRLPKVPSNVQLHPGFFSVSLPPWLESHAGPVAFLHVDCDIYSSTRDIFTALAPRIVPGTVIVFDEYFNYPHWQHHEFKAFQEFVTAHDISYEYLAYARIQVVVKILTVGR